MGRRRFGACGLALVLLAAGPFAVGADAPAGGRGREVGSGGRPRAIEQRVDVNRPRSTA